MMRREYLFVLVTLCLCILGIVAVYSVDPLRDEGFGPKSFFGRQILWNVVGWALFLLFRFFDFQWLFRRSWLWYLLSVFSLGAVLVFGESDETGAKRWLFSRSVQPSEFAKLALLFFLSSYLSTNRDELDFWSLLVKSAFFAAVPALLVFLQPDLGTVLVLGVLWFGALFLGGWHRRKLGLLLGLVASLSPLSWFIMKDYQRKRVLAFLDPWQDPLGSGYNVVQSQIAIGSGGVLGQGWLSGKQTQLRFLPARYTDFIFAAFCEQFGFVGGMVLLTLFILFFWIVLETAQRVRNLEERFFASLFGILFLFQVGINVGMNLGIAPVTGIPLPFVSYGGSSLLVHLAGAGMIARLIWRTEQEERERWI